MSATTSTTAATAMTTTTAMPRAEEMIERLERARGKTMRAMLEIADRCNEVCVHCYQVQGQKGEMSTAEVFRVLDELAASGVLVLTLSGGEPTLRSDFLEIVAYARKQGFMVRLFTNGLTMTAELASELARLSVHAVEISLYSHHAEMHDFVTGVPGAFERTVQGIRELVKNRVSVIGKTPVMSLNEGEIEAYTQFVESLGAECRIDAGGMLPREGGDRAPIAFDPSPETYRRASQLANRPKHARPARRNGSDRLCGAGDTIHVEANGELRPCTMLEVAFGQAQDGVEKSRAQSSALASLRELSWKDAHGCRDCALQSYCHRCYAASLSEVGDALAPYAAACRKASSVYEHNVGIAPRITAPPGLDPALGPYREVAPSVFEAFEHRPSPEDDALAQRLRWVRRELDVLTSPKVAGRPGELIQIRRPGRKAARTERVPGAATDQVVPGND